MAPSSPDQPALNRIEALAAVLIGLTPALIFLGRAPLAVAAGLALLLVTASTSRKLYLDRARSVIFSGTGALLAVVVLLWVPNVFASPRPDHSAFTVLRSALFVLAVVGLWAFLLNDRRKIRIALQTLTVSCLILSSIAVAAIIWWPQLFNITHFKPLEPVSAVLAYKQTGSAAVVIIPLTMLFALQNRGGWRLVALLASLLLVATIILTGSRAGMIGLIAGGACAAGVAIIKLRMIRTGVAAAMIFVAAFGIALEWNFDTHRGTPPPDAIVYMPIWTVDWHRQTIWATAWEKSADHRFFGVGANAINFLPGTQDRIGDSYNLVLSNHPHNWLVEIAAETGIVSAIWMLGVLLFLSWRLWRRLEGTGKTAVLAGVAIWVGYWVSGLFNFSYWSSWWMVSFYICLAIALAASQQSEKQTGHS